MNTENRSLGEQYFLTGMWMNDIPVNHINFWCSRCKERLGMAEKIPLTVSKLLWKPFRFEYHKECVNKALELRNSNSQRLNPNKVPFKQY